MRLPWRPLAAQRGSAAPSSPPGVENRAALADGRHTQTVPVRAQGELSAAELRVPVAVRVAAALSWRLLLILVGVGVLAWILGYLAIVTVPVAIALLLSALFAPAVARLVAWKVPRALATAITVIGGLAVVTGVLTLVVNTISSGVPQLGQQISRRLGTISEWLRYGPLHLSQQQLAHYLDSAVNAAQGNTSELFSRVVNTAATAGEVMSGALLALFTLIFFLYDGGRIWHFATTVFPADVRDRVDVAGRRGFASLVGYARGTVAVAFMDATLIGIGLFILGVPLAAPLATLIFLGAFVPIVGAVVTGSVAVLVALLAKGLLSGVIVLVIVVGVMQLEGNVLQPLLLGRAARLHPLAVVLAIALGVVVGGIAGAVLAVPILAVLNAGIRSLLHDPPLDPATVDVMRPSQASPASDPPAGTRRRGWLRWLRLGRRGRERPSGKRP